MKAFALQAVTVTRPSRPALARLFEEARTVLRTQIDALQGLDEKANHLLRFNALVTGLVLTAVSLLVGPAGTAKTVPRHVTFLFVVGFLSLVCSTGFAILAHRAERVRIGLRSEELVAALGYDVDEDVLLAEAVRSFGRGIAENAGVRSRSVRWPQRASWSLFAAMVLLSAATIGLLVGGDALW